MTDTGPLGGPLQELRRRHELTGAGRVRQLRVTNAVGETTTTEFSSDGERARTVYPGGTPFYAWVTPHTLTGAYTPPERVTPRTPRWTCTFSAQGHWLRETQGHVGATRELVRREYAGGALVSTWVYTQVSDGGSRS